MEVQQFAVICFETFLCLEVFMLSFLKDDGQSLMVIFESAIEGKLKFFVSTLMNSWRIFSLQLLLHIQRFVTFEKN